MGRGDYRNYYKGHMNKSKGEGGEGGGKWVHLEWGEGMGEKAYNCNRIINKYIKKKKKYL